MIFSTFNKLVNPDLGLSSQMGIYQISREILQFNLQLKVLWHHSRDLQEIQLLGGWGSINST